MGLFDFVSNIGNNIFNKDEEASGKIQEYIEGQNPGIDNLTVAYNDGAVTLGGQSNTYEAVEKAVLMAGNVKGVNVVLNEVAVDEPPPEKLNTTLLNQVILCLKLPSNFMVTPWIIQKYSKQIAKSSRILTKFLLDKKFAFH
jgi:hypothetical protein